MVTRCEEGKRVRITYLYLSIFPSFHPSFLPLSESRMGCCAGVSYVFLVLWFHPWLFSCCGRTYVGKHPKPALPYGLTSLTRKCHCRHSCKQQRVSFQITANKSRKELKAELQLFTDLSTKLWFVFSSCLLSAGILAMPAVTATEHLPVLCSSSSWKVGCFWLAFVPYPRYSRQKVKCCFNCFKDKGVGSMQVYSIPKLMLQSGRSSVPH